MPCFTDASPTPTGHEAFGATFKRMHYVFHVHGNMPGDYILEQFEHFLGRKKNGVVFCKALSKEKSQHFSLESPFTRLPSESLTFAGELPRAALVVHVTGPMG